MANWKDARVPFPEKGQPRDEVLSRMRTLKEQDADWRAGRTFE